MLDPFPQCIQDLPDRLEDHEHRLIKMVPRRDYLLEATPSMPVLTQADLPIVGMARIALADRPSVAVLRLLT